jgi:hypothetical protein
MGWPNPRDLCGLPPRIHGRLQTVWQLLHLWFSSSASPSPPSPSWQADPQALLVARNWGTATHCGPPRPPLFSGSPHLRHHPRSPCSAATVSINLPHPTTHTAPTSATISLLRRYLLSAAAPQICARNQGIWVPGRRCRSNLKGKGVALMWRDGSRRRLSVIYIYRLSVVSVAASVQSVPSLVVPYTRCRVRRESSEE